MTTSAAIIIWLFAMPWSPFLVIGLLVAFVWRHKQNRRLGI